MFYGTLDHASVGAFIQSVTPESLKSLAPAQMQLPDALLYVEFICAVNLYLALDPAVDTNISMSLFDYAIRRLMSNWPGRAVANKLFNDPAMQRFLKRFDSGDSDIEPDFAPEGGGEDDEDEDDNSEEEQEAGEEEHHAESQAKKSKDKEKAKSKAKDTGGKETAAKRSGKGESFSFALSLLILSIQTFIVFSTSILKPMFNMFLPLFVHALP